MSATHDFLEEVDAFLRLAGMAETTFGRKAVNDGKLVPRLRDGGSITLDKAAQIRRFMREYAADCPIERRRSHVQPEAVS
ncbi:MAG TPA: hypothetical protein VGN91_00645 [Bosea sp. (in: a-proteobacteria)]|jgi:hypothetical protein|nr:hypothetical protein [Bosea sp. (in: a-proteobacteria)]